MKKKLLDVIFPNKFINYFIITLMNLGIISGSLFLFLSSNSDKVLVSDKMKLFIDNIINNKIDYGLAIRNTLIINYLFIIIIFIMSFSIIGIIINLILTYLKGFFVGFTISSFYLVYKYKGLLISGFYVLLGELLNIIAITFISIYSLMVCIYLIKIIISKRKYSFKNLFKKYLIIFIIAIILSFISSMLEGYLFIKVVSLIM